MTFSREVTAETQERELFELLYRTLRQLLPGRSVAIRIVDPRSLEVTEVLAERDARRRRARPAADDPAQRARSPQRPRATCRTACGPADGSGRTIAAGRHAAAAVRGRGDGFLVALVAGGELTGRGARQLPQPARTSVAVREDKDLVIPLANHVAVVAHTRRLLRETVYLQDYLEQLIEQANALIIATDLEGRVTVWNRAMNRVTGFSRGEAVGKPLLPWLTAAGRARHRPGAASRWRASGDAGHPRGAPAHRWAAPCCAPPSTWWRCAGTAGKPAAVLGIGQDVTALRQLQSQVIHAEKLATLGQIAAGVAHEINNPLTSIQVCAATVPRKAQLAARGQGARTASTPPTSIGCARSRRAPSASGASPAIWSATPGPSGSEVEEVAHQRGARAGAVVLRARAGRRAAPRWSATTPRDLPPHPGGARPAPAGGHQPGHQRRPRAASPRRTRCGCAPGPPARPRSASPSPTPASGIKDEDRAQDLRPVLHHQAGRAAAPASGLSVVRNIIYSHGGQISFQSRPGSGTTFMVTLPVDPAGAAGARRRRSTV